MLDAIKSLFSQYALEARLYPALLVLLPPLIILIAWFPHLITSSVGKTLVSLLVGCGVLFLLSDFSRSAGRAAEVRLIASWGGWPTTLWLRHSDPHLDEPTKTRYHAFLASHVPGIKIPTAEEERQNPKSADTAYDSAVEWLKEQCRGTDTPQKTLVLNENIDYGFRRNMLGLRPYAVGLIVAAFLISIVPIIRRTPAPIAVYGGIAVLIAAFFGWILFVDDDWVLAAGHGYARALLACIDALK